MGQMSSPKLEFVQNNPILFFRLTDSRPEASEQTLAVECLIILANIKSFRDYSGL